VGNGFPEECQPERAIPLLQESAFEIGGGSRKLKGQATGLGRRAGVSQKV